DQMTRTGDSVELRDRVQPPLRIGGHQGVENVEILGVDRRSLHHSSQTTDDGVLDVVLRERTNDGPTVEHQRGPSRRRTVRTVDDALSVASTARTRSVGVRSRFQRMRDRSTPFSSYAWRKRASSSAATGSPGSAAPCPEESSWVGSAGNAGTWSNVPLRLRMRMALGDGRRNQAGSSCTGR